MVIDLSSRALFGADFRLRSSFVAAGQVDLPQSSIPSKGRISGESVAFAPRSVPAPRRGLRRAATTY
jgi:hypothetical protein